MWVALHLLRHSREKGQFARYVLQLVIALMLLLETPMLRISKYWISN